MGWMDNGGGNGQSENCGICIIMAPKVSVGGTPEFFSTPLVVRLDG